MYPYKKISIKGKKIDVHRFVWEENFGPIPEGYEIHHIDNNTRNNDINNLLCVTRSEHTRLHGLRPPVSLGSRFKHGHKPHNRTEERAVLAAQIKMHINEGLKVCEITRMLDVDKNFVVDVKRGRTFNTIVPIARVA